MNKVKPPTNGYEKGLEDGKRAAENYSPPVTALIGHWRQAFEDSPQIVRVGRTLEEVREQFGAMTQEDVNSHARVWHARKMAAFPDLGKFPELAGTDEYFDDHARGFAEGAGIDFGLHLLGLYWPEIYLYFMNGGSLEVTEQAG